MIAPDKLAELRRMRAAANASLAMAFVDAFEAAKGPLAGIHADLVRAAAKVRADVEAFHGR
ncbi:hypothetical protein D3218_19060 [Aureimonas flava]|uniref:Uncharacterized protein n=1 Tax=Aureimonas flava TaxID=2320271 RepID=A0A3A1WFT8_9HYPH|nr:hypothetical protein [Aureimonas flava]RIX97163.1 hypothetical protein D3218_19060 [Aureimonas flava]